MPGLTSRRAHVGERALASWLPVRTGLPLHELWHAHKTWTLEDVMSHDRLGHVLTGIGATYSRVTPSMRQDLKAGLQVRWESALAHTVGE